MFSGVARSLSLSIDLEDQSASIEFNEDAFANVDGETFVNL